MVGENDIEVMYQAGDVVLGRRHGKICVAKLAADGEWEIEEFSDLLRAFQVYRRNAHPEQLESPFEKEPEPAVRSKGETEEEIGEGGGFHSKHDPPASSEKSKFKGPRHPGSVRWLLAKPDRELYMSLYRDGTPPWNVVIIDGGADVKTVFRASFYTRIGAMKIANGKAKHYLERGYKVVKEKTK